MRGAAALAATWALAACASSPTPRLPETLEEPDPDPARVEALLLLVGDAGAALPGRSPVLASVADDVERWSARLAAGAVQAVFLGDLVYPAGVRPPDDEGHGADTLRLRAQLDVVLGAGARAAGSRATFVPGNHDWGQWPGERGRARLAWTEAKVAAWAAAGLPGRLAPTGGALGPVIEDVGARHRLLMLDTHAWLQADPAERAETTAAIDRALTGAGGRTVIVLAHHPLYSGGEHGADPPSGSGLAFLPLLSRAGAVIQDASSEPYRLLIASMERLFAEAGPPLVWAAGHDHSLQVLAGTNAGAPRWTVVSGSASKLTAVAGLEGMVLGGSWPGYARLFLLDDGGALLQVVAGEAAALPCPDPLGAELQRCLEAGAATLRTVLSRELR